MAENSTYLPTSAEERLLVAKLNPENRLKTIVELCKIAKIDPKTYYTAFKKEGFRKIYKEAVMSIFQRDAAEVAHAVVREAKRGSAQHAKMSLEMADVYTEKLEVTTETYADRLARLRSGIKK